MIKIVCICKALFLLAKLFHRGNYSHGDFENVFSELIVIESKSIWQLLHCWMNDIIYVVISAVIFDLSHCSSGSAWTTTYLCEGNWQ